MHKPKPQCPMCRLTRAADEMRKHPSATSMGAVQFKLDEMKNYEHIDKMCADHADHRVRRDICQIVEHWLNHVAATIVLKLRMSKVA